MAWTITHTPTHTHTHTHTHTQAVVIGSRGSSRICSMLYSHLCARPITLSYKARPCFFSYYNFFLYFWHNELIYKNSVFLIRIWLMCHAHYVSSLFSTVYEIHLLTFLLLHPVFTPFPSSFSVLFLSLSAPHPPTFSSHLPHYSF